MDMTCSFESPDGCYMFPRAVQRGTKFQDYWVPSLAGLHKPEKDHSLGSGKYHKVSNISRTKSQSLTDSRLVLQLPLPNPLKPGVK